MRSSLSTQAQVSSFSASRRSSDGTRLNTYTKSLLFTVMTISLGLGVGAACTSYESDFDKNAMLTRLAEDVLADNYAQLDANAVSLASALTELCEGPNQERLDTSQAAWRDARAPWKRAEAHAFGPVKDLYSRSDIDWYPTEPDKIDALLSQETEISPDVLALQGAGARGFGAIEYLLFSALGSAPDDATSDEAILAELSSGEPESARRCEYLLSAAMLLGDAARELNAAWRAPSEGGTAFTDTFGKAGQESDRYSSTQSAINDLVNALIFGLEDTADEKLGMPMGMSDGGNPHPELVQASLSGNALQDILNNLRGLEAVYRGAQDPSGSPEGESSLSGLVNSRKAAIDERILGELDTAIAAVEAIPQPLQQAVVTDAEKVQVAWDAIKVVQTSFTSDVAALLGVTLTFNDNDGD